jgi:phosphatidylinositol glycan class W
MDMGVGSFVFSQGIVSAIPVIQFVKYPADLRPSLRLEILSVLEKSLPVLVLGLLRVVLVKGTQYPVSYPSLLFVFELYTLLTMDEGTCH